MNISVNVAHEEKVNSLHTGKPLLLLQVYTNIYSTDVNEQFLNRIKNVGEEGVYSIDDMGNQLKNFKIKNSSWSYRDGEINFKHTFELEEVEILKPDYLEIGGLVINPYYYKEEFVPDGLRIESKAILTKEQHNQIKSILERGESFFVVRRGINDTPIEMDLGLGYWSKYENNYKHEIDLYEKTLDKNSNKLSSLFQWVRTMRKYVAENQVVTNGLLDILEEKNIITTDDVKKLRTDVIEQSWNICFDFFRVDEIDEM